MRVDLGKSAVGRLYKGWIDELSAIFAPQKAKSRHAWTTLLVHSENSLEIFKNVKGSAVALTRIDYPFVQDDHEAAKALLQRSSPRSTVLRLSAGDVLERIIQIPKAAADVIEPILNNQMETIVPWSKDETRYGFEIVGSNENAPDQLDIHVVATTKTILNSALERANALGASPCSIDFAPGQHMKTGVELMPLGPDPRKQTAKILHISFLIFFAMSVVISGFGFYHVWKSEVENEELERRASTMLARLAKIKKLNKENAILNEQSGRLIKRKSEEQPVMVLIEALSRALPDHAFLTELEIHGLETRIVGRSQEPTALITKIENMEQFENARFTAPTTRVEDKDLETFSIIANTVLVP